MNSTTIRAVLYSLGAALVAFAAAAAPAAEKAGANDTLKQYVAELRQNPASTELRDKIIKYVQAMKQKPPAPEEYERATVRGNAFLRKAADPADFKRVAEEFAAAVASAPWIADGYVNLAIAQEKTGQFADAVQSLNFALIADPNAKNSRDIRNKIYELEVYAEEAKQAIKPGPALPTLAPVPVTPVKKAAPDAAKKTESPEKKVKPETLMGNWYYKDVSPRGPEEVVTHAFSISQNQAGELVAAPPRRGVTIGTVSAFELAGASVKIEVSWKSSNIPGYWKKELYTMTLSDDEKKMTGTYRQQSSGARGEFSEEKTLFKQ